MNLRILFFACGFFSRLIFRWLPFGMLFVLPSGGASPVRWEASGRFGLNPAIDAPIALAFRAAARQNGAQMV